MLAGVDHLTIAPYLLTQLAQSTPSDVKSLFDVPPTVPVPTPGTSYINDVERYRITFARDLGGASSRKLTEV